MQLTILPGVLALVSIVMTILNIVQDKGILTWLTFAFSIYCIIIFVVNICTKKFILPMEIALALGALALFCLFIHTGEPEGFSAIWMVFYPPCVFMMFGLKRGTIYSLLGMIVLILFFYVFYNIDSLKTIFFHNPSVYTVSFTQRFPLLYFASCLLGFLFSSIQLVAFKSHENKESELENEARLDTMTNLLDPGAFSTDINLFARKWSNEKIDKSIGFIYVDINGLKEINDTISHVKGDEVIEETAAVIKSRKYKYAYRMGGDEFLISLAGLTDEQFDKEYYALRKAYQDKTNISVTLGKA